MYDDITLQKIQDDLLNTVRDDMDKRPSSLIYAVCAAAAPYFAQMYLELDYVLAQAFASTADREHLIMRAKEASIAIKGATYTQVKGKFNLDLPLGTRFVALDTPYKFYSVEPCTLADDGFYYAQLTCETAGVLQDESFVGACTPIDVSGDVQEIKGLTTCEIVSIISRGEDEEDTETFRQRYFIENRWEHYGGNIADYEIMMSREMGVGAVKVIPVWNGGGTVKLVLVDSTFRPCSAEFIAQIKETVDPESFEGEGRGKAPIDHTVTIESAEGVNVDVGLTLTYQDGQSWVTLGERIKEAIENYFDSVRKKWKTSSELIIRVSHIESAILDIEGVLDVTGTTLNGKSENFTVGEYSLPMLGEVTAR